MLLSGCPAPGLTENPLNTPDEGPAVVSVCYPPGVTDIDSEVLPIAVEACKAAGAAVDRPRRWKRTWFVNECPLFKSMRVTYICEQDAGEPSAEEPAPLTGNQDS